jgi:hypothetical protein
VLINLRHFGFLKGLEEKAYRKKGYSVKKLLTY